MCEGALFFSSKPHLENETKSPATIRLFQACIGLQEMQLETGELYSVKSCILGTGQPTVRATV